MALYLLAWNIYISREIASFLGGGAQQNPPPQWAKASLFMRFLNYTHNDVPQSVGLLWTNDQLVAETST